MLRFFRTMLFIILLAIVVIDRFVDESFLHHLIDWIAVLVLMFLALQLWLRHYRIVAVIFLGLATLILVFHLR